MDEYGTRRIKYWLKNSLEPALQQVGEVVKQYSQAVYTAHKVFSISQPDDTIKTVEINVPMYNDFGHVIGKWRDYKTSRFDVRVMAGSTLPLNRWAYLEELKQLMQLGVVDDIAVLGETDIRNKDKIAQRKSMYSQLTGQIEEMKKQMQDKEGTIETLERQLVQAGIKGKIMQGEMEVNRKVAQTKAQADIEANETKSMQNAIRKEGQEALRREKDKFRELINSLPTKDNKS